MTFPASVDTVTLTVGPLYDAGGALRRGVPLTVTLGRLVLIDEGGAALPTLTTASTNESGVASVVVVATDSAGIDTTGWTYHVRCDGVLTAGGIDVALPAAAPTVAIETLVAQTAADGSTVWTPGSVYSVGGLTGAVDLADLDAADLGSGAGTDGYVLTADGAGGAAWEAVPAGGSVALNDLTDVSTAGAATGEALTYNGSSWAPGAAAAILEGDARLTDARTPATHASSHDIGGADTLGGMFGPGFAVNTVAATGATETLPATHAAHNVTMDEACTFTFPTVTGAFSFMLRLAGAFTPTWPASVDWSGGSAPTYTSPALYTFTTFDSGTTWLGVQAGKAFA